jgi:protoporphyrinogen oxidase
MLNQIILGAGPSGLSFSLFNNEKIPILEKNEFVGGHTSSFFIDGYTFDYGPHIIFSKDKQILNFIVNSLHENVHKCRRNNKVSYKDRLIKYPFENDLRSLDFKDNLSCISNFIFNKYKYIYSSPKNMKEWLLYTFGEGICKKYLIPYNEKIWNIPVEQLSMVWSERIPNPSLIDVLKSSFGIATEGYLHQLYYYYPKKGGYQAISESWAKACDVRLKESVKEIVVENDYLSVKTSNNEYPTKKIISTINLSSLLGACKNWVPVEITEAYNKLIVNPMYVISIGIKGQDLNQYTAIYFSDPEFLVNRISFPCTFSKENGPENCYSIQAEITFAKKSEISKMTDYDISKHVIEGLKKKKIIKDKIVFIDIKRCQESYVVYDINYEKNIKLIRDFFFSKNIILLGRFSYFEYINIDMAINRSMLVYSMINSSKETKEDLLNKALLKINGQLV